MCCIQCKQNRPESMFLRIKKRGYKVVKCNECARKNVAAWARNVVMDPDKVKGSDE